MKTRLIILLAGILVAFNAHAQNWDFTFSYQNVFSSNALQHVVGQVNIQRTSEGGSDQDTYWNPINNGQEATLTQKFVFPQPMAQAFLHSDNMLFSANFGSSEYGSSSLWASNDGTNWIQLLNGPTPSSGGTGYAYSNNLPASLMGANQLYLQARLDTQGWNIMAQFLRYSAYYQTNNVFDLYVKYSRPFLNVQKAVYVNSTNLTIGSNYQFQVSSDLVNWANQGPVFTATNTYWRATNYWDVVNWNQLFFRLTPQ